MSMGEDYRPTNSPQVLSIERYAHCARSRQLLAVSCGGASAVSGDGPGCRPAHRPTVVSTRHRTVKPNHGHTRFSAENIRDNGPTIATRTPVRSILCRLLRSLVELSL